MTITFDIATSPAGQSSITSDLSGLGDIESMRKRLLDESLGPVADDLARLRSEIRSYLPVETTTSRQIVDHVFSAGGKYIRPAMFFLSSRLVGYRGEHLIPLGAVVEFVHTASLLHDDVIDCSTLRRNRPTSNSIWGDVASVLVGDLIYARASEMMAETGSLEVVKTYARSIRCMSEGELLQLEHVFDYQEPESHYLKVVENKTAVLIASACKTAAVLAGSEGPQIQALYEFGYNVGMAFQMVDDALDYMGSRELFGKPTKSDLKEGKVTLPVILLAKKLSGNALEELKSICKKRDLSDVDIEHVANLIDTHGSAEEAVERANQFTNRALAALEQFPKCSERDDLQRLADRLVWRFN